RGSPSLKSTGSKPLRTPTKPKRTKPSMANGIAPVRHRGLLWSMSFYFLFLGRIRRPAPLFLSVPLPAILHDGVHGVHLFLHVLRQRDLATGPDQVVLRILDPEVFVPHDVI